MTFLKKLMNCRRSPNQEEISYFGLEVETNFLGIGCIRLVSYKKLQYSSQMLTDLCDFPLPNVDLGFAVISVLQNTRDSILGKERGAFD